jgi:hypothetical protein
MKEDYLVGISNLEKRANKLLEQLQLLREAEPLHNYFKKTSAYQNSYIVEMRRLVATDLMEKGLSKLDVSRILCRDHAAVSHVLTIESAPEIKEIVGNNYKEWIANNLFPETYQVQEYSFIHVKGIRSATKFNLKPVE